MSAGFCDAHQRWMNEFGWCDECGEPHLQINPPLALSESVFDVSNGFRTDDEGNIIPSRYIRACEGSIHVYASVPGRCQCGENFWDGNRAGSEGPAPPKKAGDRSDA